MFCSYVLLDFDSGIILTSKVSWPFSKQTQVNEESAYYLETRGVFYIYFFKTRVNITVLVSQGCCNKLSQSSSLNTIEISSFRVLEIRSLKLRYHQGHASSVKALSCLSPLLLMSAGFLRHFLDFSCIIPISAFFFTRPSSYCVCASVCPPRIL